MKVYERYYYSRDYTKVTQKLWNNEIDWNNPIDALLRYQDRIWFARVSRLTFRNEKVYEYSPDEERTIESESSVTRIAPNGTRILKIDRYPPAGIFEYHVVIFKGMGTRLSKNSVTILRKKESEE